MADNDKHLSKELLVFLPGPTHLRLNLVCPACLLKRAICCCFFFLFIFNNPQQTVSWCTRPTLTKFSGLLDLLLDLWAQINYLIYVLPITQRTLPWQPILVQLGNNLHIPPSFFVLAFQNELKDRTADEQVNSGNESIAMATVTPSICGLPV